jgi:hypothetical protein
MNSFRLRAALLTAVLLALPMTSYAADAVDQRVNDRLGAIYDGGYTLDAIGAADDNWWQDLNGPFLVNSIRVITADTTSATPDRVGQTIGFYSPTDGSFQALISAGSVTPGGWTGVDNLTTYSKTNGYDLIEDPVGSSAWDLSGPTYTTTTLPGGLFEFGVKADRSLKGAHDIGDNHMVINNATGTLLLGSDRDDVPQFRAYRLTANDPGDGPPDATAGQSAYVLAFYNYNGLTSVGGSWNGAGSTGGLTAFIVTGVANPEPGSMMLLATGLVGIAGYRLRRRRNQPTAETTLVS